MDKDLKIDKNHTNVKCPVCGHQFIYEITRVPFGEKYTVRCEKCGVMLLRKRMGRTDFE